MSDGNDQDDTRSRQQDESPPHQPLFQEVADSHSFSSVSRQFISTNKKYLLAIPIVVVAILGIFVNPWTLNQLQTVLASLNGGSLNGAEYFSAAFALVGAGIMFLLAFSFLPDYDRTRLALMLEMCGAVLGWVLGMLLSPTSQSEQQTFLNAKTALLGIASGYLLSKLHSALDKAIASGKLMTLNGLTFGITFFVPLLLSTAAVYNVRAYQDLNVKISFKKSDIQTDIKDGIAEYKIELSRKSKFVAEARIPNNTAVNWSLDPAEGHGTIDTNTGEYVAPSAMPDDANVEVVAMSAEDKTKVSRLPLTLVKPVQEPPKVAKIPSAQSPAQSTDNKR